MSSSTPSEKDKEKADESVQGSDKGATNSDGIKLNGIQVDFTEDEELNAPLDTANSGTAKVASSAEIYNEEFPDPTIQQNDTNIPMAPPPPADLTASASIPAQTLVTENQAAKATPLAVDFGDDEEIPPPPPPEEDEQVKDNLANFAELRNLDGSDFANDKIDLSVTPLNLSGKSASPDTEVDVVSDTTAVKSNSTSEIDPNESEALDKFSSKIDENGKGLSEENQKKYAEEFAKLFPDISKSISKIGDKDSEESKKLAKIKPTDNKSPTQQKPGVVVSSSESTSGPKDKQQELATKGLEFAMKHPVIASMVANIVAPGSGSAVKEALEAANKSGLNADQIVSTGMNQGPGARVDSADPQSSQLDQKKLDPKLASEPSPTTVTSSATQKPKPDEESEKTQKASGEGEEENKKKEEKPKNERDNPSPGSINPWEFLFDAIAKTTAMAGAFAIDVAGGAVKGTLTATGGALKIFPGMQPMNGFKDILKGVGQAVGPAIGVVGNAVKFLPIPYAEKMGNGIASFAPEGSLKATTNQMKHEFPDAVKAFQGSPVEPKTPAPTANQPPAAPTALQGAASATQQPAANSAINPQAQQLTKIKASAAALKTDGASIPHVGEGAPMLTQSENAKMGDNISFNQQIASQEIIQNEPEQIQGKQAGGHQYLQKNKPSMRAGG